VETHTAAHLSHSSSQLFLAPDFRVDLLLFFLYFLYFLCFVALLLLGCFRGRTSMDR
jgi:hypothetical protein